MRIKLDIRQSILIGGRRVINDSGHSIELVVLNEKKEQIQIDRNPYPRKGEEQPPAVSPAVTTQ